MLLQQCWYRFKYSETTPHRLEKSYRRFGISCCCQRPGLTSARKWNLIIVTAPYARKLAAWHARRAVTSDVDDHVKVSVTAWPAASTSSNCCTSLYWGLYVRSSLWWHQFSRFASLWKTPIVHFPHPTRTSANCSLNFIAVNRQNEFLRICYLFLRWI
jgi:hypothetical protein